MAYHDITLADLPLREELRGQHAYGAPQLTVPVQLNTNENPYPPSADMVEDLLTELRDLIPTLNRYPERDALALRTELAAYISARTQVPIGAQQVWAANGSNEVLQQLLQAFGGPGRSALGFSPSYSMHPILAAGTHTRFISCPRGEDFHIDLPAALAAIAQHQPDIIFITTPNNPTGVVTELEVIEQILQAAPGIVIVDEAYAEFSAGPSAVTLLERYPRSLVVSRTMSKAFDFAGGRLGYFIAHPAVVEAILLVRLPYHLSTLSQATAIVALRHQDQTLATVDILIRERERIAAALHELGYRLAPSAANFLFFGGLSDSAQAWQDFLDREVLIRDVGQPGFLRVTIGTPAENDAFLAVATELAPRILSGASSS